MKKEVELLNQRQRAASSMMCSGHFWLPDPGCRPLPMPLGVALVADLCLKEEAHPVLPWCWGSDLPDPHTVCHSAHHRMAAWRRMGP